MPTGVSAAAAFKTLIEYVREYTEEEWKLTVSHAGQTQTLSLTVAKYPAVVPKAGRDTHRYVNWISYANIARMHHVEMDSDAYFTLLNRYLRAAVYSRQNIMNLSPGMFFSLKKGVVKLDEKRLDRYIETGKRAEIAYFNGMAFCGRADGQADNDEFYNSLPHDTFTSPDQVAAAFRKVAFDKFDNGVDVRVSLGGALVTSPEGHPVASGAAAVRLSEEKGADRLLAAVRDGRTERRARAAVPNRLRNRAQRDARHPHAGAGAAHARAGRRGGHLVPDQ